jgi:hypothetical protein
LGVFVFFFLLLDVVFELLVFFVLVAFALVLGFGVVFVAALVEEGWVGVV